MIEYQCQQIRNLHLQKDYIFLPERYQPAHLLTISAPESLISFHSSSLSALRARFILSSIDGIEVL